MQVRSTVIRALFLCFFIGQMCFIFAAPSENATIPQSTMPSTNAYPNDAQGIALPGQEVASQYSASSTSGCLRHVWWSYVPNVQTLISEDTNGDGLTDATHYETRDYPVYRSYEYGTALQSGTYQTGVWYRQFENWPEHRLADDQNKLSSIGSLISSTTTGASSIGSAAESPFGATTKMTTLTLNANPTEFYLTGVQSMATCADLIEWGAGARMPCERESERQSNDKRYCPPAIPMADFHKAGGYPWNFPPESCPTTFVTKLDSVKTGGATPTYYGAIDNTPISTSPSTFVAKTPRGGYSSYPDGLCSEFYTDPQKLLGVKQALSSTQLSSQDLYYNGEPIGSRLQIDQSSASGSSGSNWRIGLYLTFGCNLLDARIGKGGVFRVTIKAYQENSLLFWSWPVDPLLHVTFRATYKDGFVELTDYIPAGVNTGGIYTPIESDTGKYAGEYHTYDYTIPTGRELQTLSVYARTLANGPEMLAIEDVWLETPSLQGLQSNGLFQIPINLPYAAKNEKIGYDPSTSYANFTKDVSAINIEMRVQFPTLTASAANWYKIISIVRQIGSNANSYQLGNKAHFGRMWEYRVTSKTLDTIDLTGTNKITITDSYQITKLIQAIQYNPDYGSNYITFGFEFKRDDAVGYSQCYINVDYFAISFILDAQAKTTESVSYSPSDETSIRWVESFQPAMKYGLTPTSIRVNQLPLDWTKIQITPNSYRTETIGGFFSVIIDNPPSSVSMTFRSPNYINSAKINYKHGEISLEDRREFLLNQPIAPSAQLYNYPYVSDKGIMKFYLNDLSGNNVYQTLLEGTITGGAGLSNPTRMAFDSYNRMYVVDAGNDRIQVYDANGNYLKQIGTSGTSNGQFNEPYDIAINGSNYLYVVDYGNSRVQIFTPTGVFLSKWDLDPVETITGIAINGTGDIFLAGVYGIYSYSMTGNYINNFTGTFKISGVDYRLENSFGRGVAVDLSTGDVYIKGCSGGWWDYFSQSYRQRIHFCRFANGDLSQIPSSLSALDCCETAQDIDINEGYIYLSDPSRHAMGRIKISDSTTQQWCSYGNEQGQLSSPKGIAVTSTSIYVVDSGNNRLQKFSKTGSFQAVIAGQFSGMPISQFEKEFDLSNIAENVSAGETYDQLYVYFNDPENPSEMGFKYLAGQMHVRDNRIMGGEIEYGVNEIFFNFSCDASAEYSAVVAQVDPTFWMGGFYNDTIINFNITSGNTIFNACLIENPIIFDNFANRISRYPMPQISLNFTNLDLINDCTIIIDEISIVPYFYRTGVAASRPFFKRTDSTFTISAAATYTYSFSVDFSGNNQIFQRGIYTLFVRYHQEAQSENSTYLNNTLFIERDRMCVGKVTNYTIFEGLSGPQLLSGNMTKNASTSEYVCYIMDEEGFGDDTLFYMDHMIYYGKLNSPEITVYTPTEGQIYSTGYLIINAQIIDPDWNLNQSSARIRVFNPEYDSGLLVFNSTYLPYFVATFNPFQLSTGRIYITIEVYDNQLNLAIAGVSVKVYSFRSVPLNLSAMEIGSVNAKTSLERVYCSLNVTYEDSKSYYNYFDLGSLNTDASNYTIQRSPLDIYRPINNPSAGMSPKGRLTFWQFNELKSTDIMRFSLNAPLLTQRYDENWSTDQSKVFTIMIPRHTNLHDFSNVHLIVYPDILFPDFTIQVYDITGGENISITTNCSLTSGWTGPQGSIYEVNFTVPFIQRGVDYGYRLVINYNFESAVGKNYVLSILMGCGVGAMGGFLIFMIKKRRITKIQFRKQIIIWLVVGALAGLPLGIWVI